MISVIIKNRKLIGCDVMPKNYTSTLFFPVSNIVAQFDTFVAPEILIS